MNQDVFDAVNHLLTQECSSATIGAIEQGAEWRGLWETLEASGFADALVPESAGGAELPMSEALALALACGQHALPLPWAHTMLIRGLLSRHGVAIPAEPIVVASHAAASADGSVRAQVPWGRVCTQVIVQLQGQWWLLPTDEAQVTELGGWGSLDAECSWSHWPAEARRLPAADWYAQSANVTAGLIAGCLESTFEITIRYANERIQFGKPISKIQAIQQQLSVMAEHTFAARMAAQIGWHHPLSESHWQALAVAKQRTSEAVTVCAPIAHAVHGAMGFTAEYDLHWRTRRMHEWRLHFGSEGYWATQLGKHHLAAAGDALDLARGALVSS